MSAKKTGVELIAEERAAHKTREGWTNEGDDEYRNGELARAGACYAMNAADTYYGPAIAPFFPFRREWWKPKDKIRDLVRAGALIAAEIDRLQRAEG